MKQVRQELPPLSSSSSLGNKEFFKLEERSSLLLQPKDRAGKQTPGLTSSLPWPFPSLHALEAARNGVCFVLLSSKASPGEEQSRHRNGQGPGSWPSSHELSRHLLQVPSGAKPSPPLSNPKERRKETREEPGQLPHQELAPSDARHHVSLPVRFLQSEAVRTWFAFPCI